MKERALASFKVRRFGPPSQEIDKPLLAATSNPAAPHNNFLNCQVCIRIGHPLPHPITTTQMASRNPPTFLYILPIDPMHVSEG